MKAARIHQYGNAKMVEVENIEIPTPGKDMVLLEVHASSLNPADSGIREGAMKKS